MGLGVGDSPLQPLVAKGKNMMYTVYAWSVGSKLQYVFETKRLRDIWEYRIKTHRGLVVRAYAYGMTESWLKVESFYHRDRERCGLRELKGDELEALEEAYRDYEEHIISIPG